MNRDPSRWWYAMVPFPILVSLRFGLLWLTKLLLPTAGPSHSEALPVLFSGIGASLVGALVIATAPFFVAGFVLDIRALRVRSSWRPHWGYATLGVLPILGIFIEWVALLSIPSAIGYLEIRRRNIGYPLGGGETDMDTTTDMADSSAHASPSRWWLGVLIPPLLELTGAVVFWTVRSSGILRQGSDPLALLVPVALILVGSGLVPLFAISLYLDAKTVSDSSSNGVPSPQVWGLLGLGSIVGLLLFRMTFMVAIALAYVVRRRQASAPRTIH